MFGTNTQYCFCGKKVPVDTGRTTTCCQEHSKILDSASLDRDKALKMYNKILKQRQVTDWFIYGGHLKKS